MTFTIAQARALLARSTHPTDRSYLPKDFPVRRRGSCVPAAYLILRKIDGMAHQGYVGNAVDPGFEHTWVVDADGRIIDPTIRQFSFWREGRIVARDAVDISSAQNFLKHFELRYRQPWTQEGNQYRKFSQWIEPVLRRVSR